MLPFFDFMVWPRTPWPTLYMRIRRVVLRGIDVFFVSILSWPRRKIVKNYICYADGCVTGVKINYVSKNSFSNLLIRVGTAPLKYDAGMMSMYGSSPGITNCTLYLCFFG